MIIQEEEEQRVEVGDDRWDPHVREKLISKDDNTGSSLLTSVAGSGWSEQRYAKNRA